MRTSALRYRVSQLARARCLCSGSSVLPPGISHLWSTPVQVSRPALSEELNEGLTRIALDAYTKAEQAPAWTNAAAHEAFDFGKNQRFYQWQSDEHELKSHERSSVYQKFVATPEFDALTEQVVGAMSDFVDECGIELDPEAHEIFPWAAVLYSGEGHMSHVHPSSVLSGVYYSHVPPGAGALFLEDPRGPRPPFNGRVPVVPREGDLVLWPSWLQHQVIPGSFEGARVSWSFNLQQVSGVQSTAAWDATGNIHVG